MSELALDSMPDHVLIWGESGGGKAKSGMMGIGFCRLAGWEMEREGINFGGSSWVKKMIALRLKISGMGLFDYLFKCIVILRFLCYYTVNGTLYIIRS